MESTIAAPRANRRALTFSVITILLDIIGAGIMMPVVPTLPTLVSRAGMAEEQGMPFGANGAITSLTAIVGPAWAGAIFDRVAWTAPYWSGAVFPAAAWFAVERAVRE